MWDRVDVIVVVGVFFSCGGICVGGVTTAAKITKIQIGGETNDERG